MTTYSAGKNGGIASKTVNLTTLSILSAPITGLFLVNSTSAIDNAKLLQKVCWAKLTGKLLCNNNQQNWYSVDVYNNFEALSEQLTEPSTDDRYEALIAANAEAGENILPKKRKRKGIVFEIPDLIHGRNLLKSCFIKNWINSISSTWANL